jgi:predicted RNase H-like nuclease (RuvC/YqgF family)
MKNVLQRPNLLPTGDHRAPEHPYRDGGGRVEPKFRAMGLLVSNERRTLETVQEQRSQYDQLKEKLKEAKKRISDFKSRLATIIELNKEVRNRWNASNIVTQDLYDSNLTDDWKAWIRNQYPWLK